MIDVQLFDIYVGELRYTVQAVPFEFALREGFKLRDELHRDITIKSTDDKNIVTLTAGRR